MRRNTASLVLTQVTIETFSVAATCHTQYKAKEKEETAAQVHYGYL